MDKVKCDWSMIPTGVVKEVSCFQEISFDVMYLSDRERKGWEECARREVVFSLALELDKQGLIEMSEIKTAYGAQRRYQLSFLTTSAPFHMLYRGLSDIQDAVREGSIEKVSEALMVLDASGWLKWNYVRAYKLK